METLRIREIYNDARLMLVAVECIEIRSDKTNTGYRMYGNIKPIAVVVCSTAEIYALNMEAIPIAFDQLKQEIPELDTIIASFNSDV